MDQDGSGRQGGKSFCQALIELPLPRYLTIRQIATYSKGETSSSCKLSATVRSCKGVLLITQSLSPSSSSKRIHPR